VIDLLNAVCQDEDSQSYDEELRTLQERLGTPETAPNEAGTPKKPGVEPPTRNLSPEPKIDLESTPEDFVPIDSWRPLLLGLYRTLETAAKLSLLDASDTAGLSDVLMDLGMEVIDLRSACEDAPVDLSRLSVYLEKAATVYSREQIPYSEIAYELLFLLLEDLKKEIWEKLYLSGALGYKKIITMEELDNTDFPHTEKQRLWVIDLAFSSTNNRRISDFIGKIAELRRRVSVPMIFISTHSTYYRKATALLAGAIEGFPEVAGDLEEGLKLYIEAEE